MQRCVSDKGTGVNLGSSGDMKLRPVAWVKRKTRSGTMQLFDCAKLLGFPLGITHVSIRRPSSSV